MLIRRTSFDTLSHVLGSREMKICRCVCLFAVTSIDQQLAGLELMKAQLERLESDTRQSSSTSHT